MPVLSIRKDYLLSEAFELVGRHLFGTDWDGTEFQWPRYASPDEERQFREPRQSELRQIEAKLEAIKKSIAATTSKEVIAPLVIERGKLSGRQGQLYRALHDHPPNEEAAVQRYEPYRRKAVAEETLINALRVGSLKSHDGRHRPTFSAVWEGKPGFHYYIDLSMAVMPRSASPPRRRVHVCIDEESFDKWLNTLTPLTESALASMPASDQGAHVLQALLSDHSSHPAWTKDKYSDAVRKKAEISGRAFDHLWRQYAPPKLREPGARKKRS